MPVMIPDLWPDDVAVTEVISPLAILRFQAGQLRQKTRNMLEAEVVSQSADGWTDHYFEVIAPMLKRLRHRLFYVRHRDAQVYPVEVFADCFEVHGLQSTPDASTQDEFIKLVSDVLKSKEAKAVIHSLIAQSNDSGTSEDEKKLPAK